MTNVGDVARLNELYGAGDKLVDAMCEAGLPGHGAANDWRELRGLPLVPSGERGQGNHTADSVEEWSGPDGGSFPPPHVRRAGRTVRWAIEGEVDETAYPTVEEARAAYNREIDEYLARAAEEDA